MKLPVHYKSLHWKERRKVRGEYINLQQGKCYFCGGDLNDPPPTKITNKPINWSQFPEGFLNYPIHLQHCHKTGMTEGAVHAYCNAVMWQYHGR